MERDAKSLKQELLNLSNLGNKLEIKIGGLEKSISLVKNLRSASAALFNGKPFDSFNKGVKDASARLSEMKSNLEALKKERENYNKLQTEKSLLPGLEERASKASGTSPEIEARKKALDELKAERELYAERDELAKKEEQAAERFKNTSNEKIIARYVDLTEKLKGYEGFDFKYDSVEEYDKQIEKLTSDIDVLQKEAERPIRQYVQMDDSVKQLESQSYQYGSDREYADAIETQSAAISNLQNTLNNATRARKEFNEATGNTRNFSSENLDSFYETVTTQSEEAKAELDRVTEATVEAQAALLRLDETPARIEVEGADEVSDALSGAVGSLNTSVSEETSKLASSLGSLKEKAIVGIASGIRGVMAASSNFGETVASNFIEASKGAANLGKSIMKNLGQKAISSLKPLGNALVGVSKSLLGISAFQSMGNAIGGFLSRIGRLATGAFVFRVIGAALRKLKSDIVETFSTYLNYDSSLNSSINTLKTQYATLKGQLASAFSPIISMIVPALSTFVGWCVSAANAMSALIASLTGKTSWKKAVVNSVGAVGDAASGAADDLGDAADKAEELKEKLGNYDKLNVIGDDNKPKSSGSGSKGSGGSGGAGKGADISYVDQTIGDGIRNLADWLKDMWKKADFTELGALVGQKLKDALDKIPWADIKQKAYDIGKSIATFLSGFFRTPGLGTTLGNTIAEFINTGLYAAYGFVHNFDFSAFGQFIVDGINAVIRKLDFSLAAATLKEGLDGIFTVIKTATDPISGIRFDLLGDKISGFIEDVVQLDWDTAKTGFYNLGRGIADFASHLIKPSTLGALGTAVAECINVISGAFKGFIDNAKWEQYGLSIAAFFNNLVTKVNWEQVGADFGGAIHGLLTTIKEAIANLSFTEIADAFKEFFKGVFSELTWGDVATILLSLLGFSILKGVATTLMTSLAGLGTAVVSGIVSLIVGALPVVAVVAIVAALIYMLWNSVNKAIEDLDKKDWHAIGAKIREYIVKGIDGVVNLALDFIANIKEGTKDIPILGWIIGFIADGAELAVKVLGKLAKGDIIGAIKEWIVGGIKITANIASKVVDAGKSAINWIRDRFTGAKEWVANIKAKMKDALEESPVFKWLYEKFMTAKEWFANIKAKMKDALEESPVFKWLYDKFVSAKEWFANIKAKISDGMEDSAFKGFLEWIKGIADSVVSFSLSVLGSFGEGVQDFIDWAGNGLNAAREFGANIIGSVSDAITGFFSDKKEVFGDGTEVTLTANVETPGVEEGIDLAGTLQGKIQEIDKMALESIGEYTKQAQDAAKETGNWETNLGKTKESANQNALAMGGLAEKYFDLAEKTNRTAGEEEQLRAIADKLKDAYPELGDAIDENTGLLTLNRDAVLGLIESRKQEAIMDTLIDEYGKVSAAIEINKSTVSAAEASYSTFKNKLKELGWSEGTIKEFQDLGAAIKAGSTDQDTIDKYESLKKQLKELGIPQSEIDQIIEASTKMGELRKASQDMAEQKSNVEKALSDVATQAAEVATNVGKAGDELNEVNGTEATVGVSANDTATPVIEGVEEQRSSLDGNDAVFDLGATDSATQVVEGVKTEQGTVSTNVNTEYTATDNTTQVTEGVKTEQGTVPTTVNTEYTATDNTNGVPGEVESATNKVPDQKTVSFVEIGGMALATIASITIAAALALIPSEKKVTFTVENNTAEPIKSIKDDLSTIKAHVVDTVSPAIKSSIKTTFEASATDAKNALVGADSIQTAMTALKGHISTILGGLKRTFSNDFSEIHSAVKNELLQNAGIEGDFNTLHSNARSIVERLKSDVVSIFSAMRQEANYQISAIQSVIDQMHGRTVRVDVTDEGTAYNVMALIERIPTYHRVVIEAVWSGDTDRSFYATVYWDNVQRAIGGILRGHTWEDLPNVAHYAGGTARAHGTVFVAGENGAEAVGNINGHTEVLNKSQLAAAMYGSVLAAVARSGSSIAEYIVQNIVSCTNVLVSAISRVPSIVQTLGGNLLNMVNEALSSGSEDEPEQTNLLREMISINRESSPRVTELIEAQREISPMLSRVLDFLSMSFEAQRQAHVESAQLSNALQALALAGNGERLIDLIVNLDGRVIYEDMVQIDRGTQRITGRSGFAT